MEVVAQSGVQETVYGIMAVGNLEDRLRKVGIQAQFADWVKVHRQGVVGILQQIIGRRKGIGLFPTEVTGQREFGLKPRESVPLGRKRGVQGMVAQVVGPFVLCHILLVVGVVGLSAQTEVCLAKVLTARQRHTPGGFRAVVPHGGYQSIVGQVEAFKVMVGVLRVQPAYKFHDKSVTVFRYDRRRLASVVRCTDRLSVPTVKVR